MITDLTSPRYTDAKKYFANNLEENIVLAVDLDEVCFDYLGGLREVLQALGYTIPAGQTSSWSLVESGWVKTEDDFKKHHSAAVEEGLYTKLKILPGAREMLWELVRAGYEINFITSRFVVNKQHQIIVQQTAEALDFHDLPYSNLMFQKQKNRFIADAYLDDGPHNIEALRADGRFVIKINQLYNIALAKPDADNWWHARNVLKQHFGR